MDQLQQGMNTRDRCRPDFSFHLEINEVAKDYLSFSLYYRDRVNTAVTSGALSLEQILDTFRDVVEGTVQVGA